MMRGSCRKGICGLAIATLGFGLGGCETSRTVSGKVLPGPTGVATVVQENDPRLEEPGVGGVDVRISDGATGLGSVAQTTTAPDGAFSLRVPERAMTRRLEVLAEGEDIVRFRGSSFLPMDGRRLLIFVERRGAAERER